MTGWWTWHWVKIADCRAWESKLKTFVVLAGFEIQGAIICCVILTFNKRNWLSQPDFPINSNWTNINNDNHVLANFYDILTNIVFVYETGFVKKVLQTNACARHAPEILKLVKWKCKIKLKDLSLFIVVDLYLLSQCEPIHKKIIVHFV